MTENYQRPWQPDEPAQADTNTNMNDDATAAPRTAEPAAAQPDEDRERLNALRSAYQPQAASAPAPAPKRRAGRLAVAGMLLLASLSSGVVGSAATLALTNQNSQNAAIVQQSARPTSRSVSPGAALSGVDIAALAQEVSPSVVKIVTRETASRTRPTTQGQGSGFIVDNQGQIITNYHVVEGASRITVVLRDGTQVQGKVVGADPQSDLAVVKADIPADKLTVATLGDSDAVQPDETAVAIGSPFGLDQTITAGIVSAVKRDWGTANGRPMRGLIQTDAPVNPGNSGGPLFNANGEVIGITTAIESPVEGSVGIGFAIPINQAKKLLPDLSTGKSVEHPWLGIAGMAVSDAISEGIDLPVKQGVLVTEATANGPALKAGLRGGRAAQPGDIPTGGDIITAVDGKPVTTVQQVADYINTKKVGDTVKLTILRDGKQQEVTVTLGAWQSQQQG